MTSEKELREKVVSTAQSYLGAKQGSAKHKKIIDTFNTVKPEGCTMTYTAYWCAAFASADANKRLDDLYGMQEEAAIEACKNFLTHALVDIENGAKDEVLKRRIHSAHTWYNNHHQNSYIDTKFNKLVDEGKL